MKQYVFTIDTDFSFEHTSGTAIGKPAPTMEELEREEALRHDLHCTSPDHSLDRFFTQTIKELGP